MEAAVVEPKVVVPVEPVAQNPFYPKLINSTPLNASAEQKYYINEILKIVCSDSQFRNKALLGITYIMNGGVMPLPTVASLNPATVVLGEPSFDIHVMGTNFTPLSVILFNGVEEPTTFVSPTELTTGVNMPLWQAPAVVPIAVQNGLDIKSNSVDFSFTAPVQRSTTVPNGAHEGITDTKPAIPITPKVELKPAVVVKPIAPPVVTPVKK
jgi:hypothetical protein